MYPEHIHILDIYTQINRRIFYISVHNNIWVHLHEDSLPSDIRHVPLWLYPPKNTNDLTLVRTRRFFEGAEDGTEVNWLDGYSPKITIFCASPLLPGSPHIHSHIHCEPQNSGPASGRSTLNCSCNFRCSGCIIPDVPKPGELALEHPSSCSYEYQKLFAFMTE